MPSRVTVAAQICVETGRQPMLMSPPWWISSQHTGVEALQTAQSAHSTEPTDQTRRVDRDVPVRAATGAEEVEGSACEPDGDVEVTQVKVEQVVERLRGVGRARRLHGLAALDGARGARLAWRCCKYS